MLQLMKKKLSSEHTSVKEDPNDFDECLDFLF